jgi:hypothetical protein
MSIFRNLLSGVPSTVEAGTLMQVKHDQEQGIKPRNDPETFKSLTDKMFQITPAIAVYWQGLLRLKNPNMTDPQFNQNWRGLTASNRAFTNKHGWDSGDFRIENIICGGATVRTTTGIPFRTAGYWYYEVYALDPLAIPVLPSSAVMIDMTLNFLPTISTGIKVRKFVYRVNAFPQFNGNSIVPYFGVGGKNAIRADHLRVVTKVNSPFIP